MYSSKECKEKIVSFLKEKIHPTFMYLFGSFARGERREDSDIDITDMSKNVDYTGISQRLFSRAAKTKTLCV